MYFLDILTQTKHNTNITSTKQIIRLKFQIQTIVWAPNNKFKKIDLKCQKRKKIPKCL